MALHNEENLGKKFFLDHEVELTIGDPTPLHDPNCAICFKPIYQAKCDHKADTHDHYLCSKERKSKTDTDSHQNPLQGDQLPEPGLKIKACGHIFGRQCFLRWVETEHTCPMCRTKLFKPFVERVITTGVSMEPGWF
jgi:hypothetical protein